MALLALIITVGLVILVLPAFNGFLGKTLSLWESGKFLWFVALLGLAVFVGLLAESYPAARARHRTSLASSYQADCCGCVSVGCVF